MKEEDMRMGKVEKCAPEVGTAVTIWAAIGHVSVGGLAGSKPCHTTDLVYLENEESHQANQYYCCCPVWLEGMENEAQRQNEEQS